MASVSSRETHGVGGTCYYSFCSTPAAAVVLLRPSSFVTHNLSVSLFYFLIEPYCTAQRTMWCAACWTCSWRRSGTAPGTAGASPWRSSPGDSNDVCGRCCRAPGCVAFVIGSGPRVVALVV